MWNKNRCMPYSSIVQMMFPMKKHAIVLAHESAGMAEMEWKGSHGLDVKGGSGPVNWKAERRNRLAVMGAQKRGTTYQTVRVQILVNVSKVLFY